MKKYNLELDQHIVTYIERLHYEYEVLRDNVAYMIERFGSDETFMQNPLFKKYQESQIQAKKNLDYGMQEVYDKYIPDKFKSHNIEWTIEFRRNLLTITQYCNCEVEDETR